MTVKAFCEEIFKVIAPPGFQPRGWILRRHPKFPRVEKHHFFVVFIFVICEIFLI